MGQHTLLFFSRLFFLTFSITTLLWLGFHHCGSSFGSLRELLIFHLSLTLPSHSIVFLCPHSTQCHQSYDSQMITSSPEVSRPISISSWISLRKHKLYVSKTELNMIPCYNSHYSSYYQRRVHPGNATPNTWLFWWETQISPVVSSSHFLSGTLYSTSSIVLKSAFFSHRHHHHPMVQNPLLPLPAHRPWWCACTILLSSTLAFTLQCEWTFQTFSPIPSLHCFKALKVLNVFHCL